MLLREGFDNFSEDCPVENSPRNFKARSINPHLFEHASKLPQVERKIATTFK
jgi:hypothetical protein